MKIMPVKSEYRFEAMNHTMKAVLLHVDNKRRVTYYFDDKVFGEREIEEGDFWTDDDNIRSLAESYFADHTNVMSDLFVKHASKIKLKDKTNTFVIDNNGLMIDAVIVEEKGLFNVKITSANERDVFTGRITADSNSEALEKLRIFVNTLSGISMELTRNIDEFNNDKVKERIDW